MRRRGNQKGFSKDRLPERWRSARRSRPQGEGDEGDTVHKPAVPDWGTPVAGSASRNDAEARSPPLPAALPTYHNGLQPVFLGRRLQRKTPRLGCVERVGDVSRVERHRCFGLRLGSRNARHPRARRPTQSPSFRSSPRAGPDGCGSARKACGTTDPAFGAGPPRRPRAPGSPAPPPESTVATFSPVFAASSGRVVGAAGLAWLRSEKPHNPITTSPTRRAAFPSRRPAATRREPHSLRGWVPALRRDGERGRERGLPELPLQGPARMPSFLGHRTAYVPCVAAPSALPGQGAPSLRRVQHGNRPGPCLRGRRHRLLQGARARHRQEREILRHPRVSLE